MRYIFLIFISIFLSGKVIVLDSVNLEKFSFKDLSFNEISDVAYNLDDNKLYMVSDKGIIFAFEAKFDSKIHLKPLWGYKLNKKGKRLKLFKRDSEGLCVVNGKPFVSFEGKPRVAQIGKKGKIVKYIKLPKDLKKAKLQNRNKGLESLAYHPEYGFLMAFEYPPKGRAKCNQIIYSTSGKKWDLHLESYKNCAISALEVIDNENILVLERAYGGIFSTFVVTLKKFNLKTKQSKVIFQIDKSSDMIQNYEGLAKIDNTHYLMVSDDNNNPFASSILMLLEIK